MNELVGGVNGAGLTPVSIAGSGASGGDRIMGAEAGVHHKLAEVGWFAESDRGGFGEEVLGSFHPGPPHLQVFLIMIYLFQFAFPLPEHQIFC